MSFFQDLKDDLSEAVNELMINENEEEELKEEVFEDPADDDSVIDEETEEGDTQTEDLLAEADLLFSPEEIAALENAGSVEDAIAGLETATAGIEHEESAAIEETAQAEEIEEAPIEETRIEEAQIEEPIEEAPIEEAPIKAQAEEAPEAVTEVVDIVAHPVGSDKPAEEVPDSVMKQPSLLGDIDLNSMLESIQSELNAQKDSMEAGAQETATETPEVETISADTTEEELSSIVENSVKEEAEDNAASADEDNIEGQMSLEEMFSGIPAVLPEAATEAATEAAEEAATEAATEAAAEAATESASEPSVTEQVSENKNVETAAEAIAETVNETVTAPVAEKAEPEVKEEKKPARKTTRRKKAAAAGNAAAQTKPAIKVPDDRVLSDETAQLLAGVKITGNIVSDGNLDLGGEVEGDIDILGKINVSGAVCGNIKAGEIYAEGAEINGSITCEGSVKIGQGAVIIGDLNGASAVIAGAVKGNIDVKGPVILADTAIVMGDIRSASVQISNGAAIEGMCSQVYAEVNPGVFFADFDKAKK